MAELKTRIKHKNGTPDEWSQATNFSPLKGELVVYNDATNPRMKIGDGETNVNDLPFVNNAFVTVNLDGADDGEDFVPDTSKYFIQPRNMLDNSDFRNPINQRGQTAYTGTGYGIDRWRTNFSGDTIELVSNGVKNTVNSTTNGWHLFQIVPNMARFVGNNVTAACKAVVPPSSDIRLVCSFRDASDDEISNIKVAITMGICVVNGKVPTGTEAIRFGLYAYGAKVGDAIIVEWAGLYEGAYTTDTLLPYVPKGYTAELDACHNRFYRFDDIYSFISSGFIANSGAAAYTVLNVPYLDGTAAPTVTGKVHIAIPTNITDNAPTATTFVAEKVKGGALRLATTLDSADSSLGGKPCVITIRSGDYLEISRDL